MSLNDFPKAQVNEAQGKVFEARITDENRINAVTLDLLVTKDESFLTAAVQFFESVDNSNTVIESKGTATLAKDEDCLLYTSPSPRDHQPSRMPSSA